jgi:hypothetical protein
MVLAVGDIDYKKNAKEVLEDYFNKNSIPYVFIEEAPKNLDLKGAHPSWWKLLAHSIIPNKDFIICWDLDLLPSSATINVISDFNMNMLCMAVDSTKRNFPDSAVCQQLPNFKYNGGLIGIPKSMQGFTKFVFDSNAPGTLPSYEQYYLNECIAVNKIPMHELPSDFNVFYGHPHFEVARLQHYTGSEEAKLFISQHYNNYFGIKTPTVEPSYKKYDTRINMISDLVPEGAAICEMGVFKGDMAKFVDKLINPSLFVLIDFFTGITGSGDQDGNNFEYVDLEQSYNQLRKYFEKNPNIKILQNDTVSGLAQFPNESFDMIYIDADHSYEGCKRDLEASYKKLKKGGYLMGHDYEMNMNKAKKSYFFGVKKAVDEFCKNYSETICAKGYDGCVSYAIRKT